MKAIVYRKYGSPDVLKLEETEKPVPQDNEVLVKIRAASVNPCDWHFMRGTPYFLRLAAGLRKPRDSRLGVDVAGEVEAVGRNVTQFKSGDPVFGCCRGALAEYACVSESALVRKPNNLTFEQGASIYVAALTALQGLRDKGHIQSGKKVLINGAAGGVGTFAVQMAKSFGAEVTGVCSTRNVEMVRSLGADHVIDYTQEDFTNSGQRYDLVFDCVWNHSLAESRCVLNPNGIYVVVGGPSGKWMLGVMARLLTAPVLSLFLSRKMLMFVARPSKEDLIILRTLVETGKVTPVIDRRYSLSDVPEAIRYLEQGHARGKVVVAIS